MSLKQLSRQCKIIASEVVERQAKIKIYQSKAFSNQTAFGMSSDNNFTKTKKK